MPHKTDIDKLRTKNKELRERIIVLTNERDINKEFLGLFSSKVLEVGNIKIGDYNVRGGVTGYWIKPKYGGEIFVLREKLVKSIERLYGGSFWMRWRLKIKRNGN